MMETKGLIHPSDYISMYEFYTREKVLHTTKISTFSKNYSLQHIFNPIVIKQNKVAAKALTPNQSFGLSTFVLRIA